MTTLRKLICAVLVLAAVSVTARAAENALGEAIPFRVCAMAGTPDRPWVGIVWEGTDEAALLKTGDVFRGYKLKAVDMNGGIAVFEFAGRDWELAVEADPLFAEKHLPVTTASASNEYLTAEEFLNRHPVVVLADGTRLEQPPGGWANKPVSFEEFIAQHKEWEGVGLTAADEAWAQHMAEAAAESEKAAQQLQSQEDIERARYEALSRMAAEVGMEPPKPEDLKPITYEEFIRLHGGTETTATPSAHAP